MGTPHCRTDRPTGLHAALPERPADRTPTAASFYTPGMARWSCAACGAMTDDIFATCDGCRDLRLVGGGRPDVPTLVLLYPGDTQVDAASRYRDHARQLSSLGYVPVATSWGEQRPDAGSAFFFGNLEEAYRVGALLVTYRREGAP